MLLPRQSDATGNDLHQHSYDIDSEVISGSLRSELYRFEVTPNGTQREFAVSYEADRSIICPTGRVGELQLFCAFETVAGTKYFLQAGRIHRVTISARPCVTILSTEERGVPIFAYGEPDEPSFARRLVSPSQAQQIGEVLAATPVERQRTHR
jgi:hypothetical protein